jgi:uncharacterized protein YecE (DUF72 family)
MKAGDIRVGIGGWTFEPWRGLFYPDKHPHARELDYASRQLRIIEINGTYYSTQKPKTWADWAARVPDGFVFTVKASRFCTNRRVLADAGESVAKFVNQGLAELGPKLGPILWQFMATKAFDPDDFGAFLKLLPDEVAGVKLRHAVEPRHESFRDPAFVAMTREAGAAIVVADDETHPQIADVTAPFVYARLQRQRDDVETGYPADELGFWADTAMGWATGREPDGLGYAARGGATKQARDVFVFMINGAKRRAPAAAQALQRMVG